MLVLPIKKKWYDMILSGEKEYFILSIKEIVEGECGSSQEVGHG